MIEVYGGIHDLLVPASEQSRKARRCVPRGLTGGLLVSRGSVRARSGNGTFHVPFSKFAGGQSPTGALTKKRLLTLFPRICFRSCAGALPARARLALDQESAHPNSVAATKNRRPAKADLRFLVEVTGLAPLAARPRRSKASFAGVRLWQTPHFHRLLLLFPQIFCCAKSLREPCHQPTGLFSLRLAILLSYDSRANRLLPQTPPPSSPVMVRNNTKRS